MAKRTPGKPRGVLRGRRAEEAASFHHSRHAPADDLLPFIEHFWIVGWDLEGREPHLAETLPHPSVHIVLERGVSRVAGVNRKRFSRLLEGKGVVFGIKFLPGGFYPFVGWPVSRITDRVLPLPEVFAGEGDQLETAVLGDADDIDIERLTVDPMLAAATAFLRARLPRPDRLAAETGEIVLRISSDREINKVDDLVSRIGSSVRQLQRLFSRYIGVSPKWVIQRYRLHEALERIEATRVVDWPQLALDLGYSDQAHFIRAFKALIGRTPGEYAEGLREPK